MKSYHQNKIGLVKQTKHDSFMNNADSSKLGKNHSNIIFGIKSMSSSLMCLTSKAPSFFNYEWTEMKDSKILIE